MESGLKRAIPGGGNGEGFEETAHLRHIDIND